jgi:predicted CoA-binding protein
MPKGRRLTTEDDFRGVVAQMQTVAVLGAKGADRPYEPASSIPQMLEDRGYEVIRISPTLAAEGAGLGSVAELERAVDVLDVFRRPAAIPDHVDEVLAMPEGLRPKVVWLQTGIRHDEATERLLDAGIDVVQDACLGVMASRFGRRPTA